MNKKRINITLSPDTQERLLQFGYENHINGGLSGVIEFIAWNQIKVANAQLKGQLTIEDTGKKTKH